MADAATVAAAVRGCDVVFHLAARGSVQRSVEQPLATDRTNVAGTLTVLAAAHEAGVRSGRAVVVVVGVRRGGSVADARGRNRCSRGRRTRSASSPASTTPASSPSCTGCETVTLRYFNVFGPAAARRQPVRRRRAPVHRRAAARRSPGRGPRRRRAEPRLHVRRRRRRAPTCAAAGRRRALRRAGVYNIARGEPAHRARAARRARRAARGGTPIPSTSPAGPATSATRTPSIDGRPRRPRLRRPSETLARRPGRRPWPGGRSSAELGGTRRA